MRGRPLKRGPIFLLVLLLVFSEIVYAQPATPQSSYSEKPIRWQTLSGFYEIGSAAGVKITAKTIENNEASVLYADADGDSDYDSVFKDSVRLSVILNNAEVGKDYVVILSDTTGAPNADTNIYYAIQATANGQNLTFDVFPPELNEDISLYLSITSDSDSFASLFIPVSYCCDRDCWIKPTGETLQKGDVNNDGSIDASDLTALARHIAKIDVIRDLACLDAADVTYDGAISAADLTKLARYVAKIITDL